MRYELLKYREVLLGDLVLRAEQVACMDRRHHRSWHESSPEGSCAVLHDAATCGGGGGESERVGEGGRGRTEGGWGPWARVTPSAETDGAAAGGRVLPRGATRGCTVAHDSWAHTRSTMIQIST